MRRFTRRALPLVAAGFTLTAAAPAQAAPVQGPADSSFYTPPRPAANYAPGELVWWRPAALKLGAGAPSTNNWTFLYRTTDSNENPTFATGTIIVPRSGPTGVNRPLLAYAFGTQGLAPQCAPSKQLIAGTEYEAPNVIAALNKGFAVIGSDYPGFTNGSVPSYTAGKSEGYAVLDAVRAATQFGGASINIGAKTVIWGYSQGGQAAAWAGQLHPTYAPNVNLVGIAAGGTPANLRETAFNLDGSVGASFLLQSIVGLSTEYPSQIPFDSLSNAAGKAARTDAITNLCTFAAFNKYINATLNQFTAGNKGLTQLLNENPAISQVVDGQRAGLTKVNVPVYAYHGQADEIVPLAQSYQLKRDWCSRGTVVRFDLYPSEHLTTLFQAAPTALQFLADRANGLSVATNCALNTPPTSTAEAAGGDFIVNLSRWKLAGALRLAKLGQSVVLPSSSLFDGSANLTQKTITGRTLIAPFQTTVTVLGIPARVSITLLGTGPIVGTIALDDQGNLRLRGNAPISIRINSLSALGLNLGTNCRTEIGTQIPLSFDGPVSALGTGKFTSVTQVTIPTFTDCGGYGPILSGLISGTGNTIILTESPPDPVAR
jgi:pimeloyl-ACP methyl ester carboxylesterase